MKPTVPGARDPALPDHGPCPDGGSGHRLGGAHGDRVHARPGLVDHAQVPLVGRLAVSPVPAGRA